MEEVVERNMWQRRAYKDEKEVARNILSIIEVEHGENRSMWPGKLAGDTLKKVVDEIRAMLGEPISDHIMVEANARGVADLVKRMSSRNPQGDVEIVAYLLKGLIQESRIYDLVLGGMPFRRAMEQVLHPTHDL